MNYENLNKKYLIKIIAVNKDDPNEMYDLFATPIEEFGGMLMRVMKDSVAEKLYKLNEDKKWFPLSNR